MRTIQHYGVTIRGETSPVYVLADSSGNTLSFGCNRGNPFKRIKEAWLFIKVDNNLNDTVCNSNTIKVAQKFVSDIFGNPSGWLLDLIMDYLYE